MASAGGAGLRFKNAAFVIPKNSAASVTDRKIWGLVSLVMPVLSGVVPASFPDIPASRPGPSFMCPGR